MKQLTKYLLLLLPVIADHVDENQCYVKLKWKPPTMFRSENGKYQLHLQDKHQQYVTLPTLCLTVSDHMECSLPMSTFTPYLREADPIKVKALPFIGL